MTSDELLLMLQNVLTSTQKSIVPESKDHAKRNTFEVSCKSIENNIQQITQSSILL